MRTLYYAQRSPYARKVRIILAEKNLAHTLKEVDMANKSADFLQLSPIGKVPVFVDEDGTTLWDSTLIVEYLEDTYPEPSFYPSDRLARLKCRQWEEVADMLSDRAVQLMFEKRRGEQANSGDISKFETGIERIVSALDAKLATSTYLMAEDLTIVDVTAVSSLGYYSLRFGEDWKPKYLRLAHWFQELHKRDSVQSTIPKP